MNKLPKDVRHYLRHFSLQVRVNRACFRKRAFDLNFDRAVFRDRIDRIRQIDKFSSKGSCCKEKRTGKSHNDFHKVLVYAQMTIWGR